MNSNKNRNLNDEAQPYCRAHLTPTHPSLPTKLTPRITIPCDKIYMKVKHRIDIAPILRFKDSSTYYKAKRGYRLDDSYSGLFKIKNKSITIHSNDAYSEIQVNPTQWDSLRGLEKFILTLTQGEEPTINNLALNVDIPFALKEVRKSMTIKYKSKTTIFRAETVTRRAGITKDVEYTGAYGSPKTTSIVIYDVNEKHPELDLTKPSTRIEARYHANRFSPANTLSEMYNISGEAIFGRISLLKARKLENLSGKEELYYELLTQYVETVGLKEGLSRIGKLDPKHGYTITRSITEKMESFDVNLVMQFDRQMLAFARAPVSKLELAMVKMLEIERSKTSGRVSPPHLASSKTSTSKLAAL